MTMNTMNENAKDQQRLGQLKNLVMLASADERLTDSELAVLLAVASRERIPNLPTCATWWR